MDEWKLKQRQGIKSKRVVWRHQKTRIKDVKARTERMTEYSMWSMDYLFSTDTNRGK